MNEYVYTESNRLTLNEFILRTFVYMAGGLLLTAITAFLTLSTGFLFQLIRTPFLFLFLFIGQIGLVIFLSNRVYKLKITSAFIAFGAYSVLNGITLSTLALSYGLGLIAIAFCFTAVLFVNMAIIGFITKTDLTKFSSLILPALITLIIISAVGMWMSIPGMTMVVSYLGVAIFLGLTAYDVQVLKKQYHTIGDDGVQLQAAGIFGALQLYLNFINLFLRILRLLGKRR